MKKNIRKIFVLLILALLAQSCQKQQDKINSADVLSSEHSDTMEDDFESDSDSIFKLGGSSCKQATAAQISSVDAGAAKLNQFLNRCYQETKSKKWCSEVARPNPDSHRTFDCTYSPAQPHVFVHPQENTWGYAIGAVNLVLELEKRNIKVDTIYNWWRPEPYNKNVGGAAGRHPAGTSVDVRFSSKTEQNKAHSELCKFRKLGRLRALGYYSGTGLHLGVGDTAANTWGRSCPK